MRFMADVYMKCPECHGARYRREVLEVKYRGLSIADVLESFGPRGVQLLPRPQEGARAAEVPDRRGARLPAARPTGQHALAAASRSG